MDATEEITDLRARVAELTSEIYSLRRDLSDVANAEEEAGEQRRRADWLASLVDEARAQLIKIDNATADPLVGALAKETIGILCRQEPCRRG